MNQNLKSSCENLPDSEISAVLRELFQAVFKVVPPSDLHDIPELDALMAKGDTLLEAKIDKSDHLEIGRSLLNEFAGNPELAPFLEEAFAETSRKMQKRMFIPGFVEFGTFLMLSYLIMSASGSIKKDKNGKVTWSLVKRAGSPQMVEKFLARLTDIGARALRVTTTS